METSQLKLIADGARTLEELARDPEQRDDAPWRAAWASAIAGPGESPDAVLAARYAELGAYRADERWLDLVAYALGRAAPPVEQPPEQPAASAFVGPFVSAAAFFLTSRLENDAVLGPEAWAELERELARELAACAEQVVTLELNLWKAAPTLATASSWITGLDRRTYGEILVTYPALARILAERALLWVDRVCALVARFTRDGHALHESLAVPPGARVVSVQSTLGDPHLGGGTALILHLEPGPTIVYKPRPVDAEAYLLELDHWLAARNPELGLRLMPVIPRQGYGWMGFAPHRACRSMEEIEKFYRCAGRLLGILHLLCGTDMNHENIIAMGDAAVPIDTEMLFTPQLHPDEHEARSTVLDTLLLPTPAAERPDHPADPCGLGSCTGSWNSRGQWFASQHQPRLGDRRVPAHEHAAAIDEGFTAIYRAALRHERELIAQSGPLERAASIITRIVRLTTVQYARILGASFQPELLRAGYRRGALLESLTRGLWTVEHDGARQARTVRLDEIRSLLVGDVPYFQIRADAAGAPVGFVRSGLDRARRRIERLSEDDLDRQRAIIHQSFRHEQEERVA